MKKVTGRWHGIEQIWMKPWGDLVLVEWNACGCHPNDVCMRWGKGFNDAGWYGSQNKSAWTKSLLRKGWERL
jgi:hypothetical protein